MPGRKPKPTRLKLIEGNPGRRPLNQNEPEPPVVTEVSDIPPRGMSQKARIAWKHYAPMLREAGLLTVVDIPALTLLCEHYSLWQDGLNAARKEGASSRGPARLSLERDAKIVQSLLADFGMSPSARSRVSAQPPDGPDDDVARFLFGDM